MGQTAILEEIKKLSTRERLEIIGAAIHQLQEGFEEIVRSCSKSSKS